MTTTVTLKDGVATITLDEGRGNALSYETIAALERALSEVERSGARAVILTGAGKVFCAGLDLPMCARFDRAAMARYVVKFEALFERLFTFPLPIVAALNGHAIAGGAVIALACDVRVMESTATIALNEVLLGLPFPSMAFEIGRFGFPPHVHLDGVLLGKTFGSGAAVMHGIAVDIADVELPEARRLEESAQIQARQFLERGAVAVTAVKRALRAEALARAHANAIPSQRTFLDAYFSDDTQKRIEALVAKLKKPA